MDNPGALPFHIRSIDPPVADFSLLPLPSSAVLTVPRGGVERTGVKSMSELADLIKNEALARPRCGIHLSDPMSLSQVFRLGEEMARFEEAIFLVITAELQLSGDPPAKAPPDRSGIKLVEWVHPKGRLETLAQILKMFSKAGIWNHVRLSAGKKRNTTEPFARFVADNPSIVHSWEMEESGHPSSFDSCGETGIRAGDPVSSLSAYPPLPGRPFWQCVPDPVHLLLYLNEYGRHQVGRWWVPAKGDTLMTLGETLEYHFVTPQALAPQRLDEICRMVTAGGSVGDQWVRYNLERAFLIAYVTEMDAVVANSSLKNSRAEYIATLIKRTGMDFSGYLERGYTSVRPEYRGMGIGTRLLEGLTSRVGDRKLFSLIGEDNIATQKIALRNNTRKVATFYSEQAGKRMGVWVPEAMLDDFVKNTKSL